MSNPVPPPIPPLPIFSHNNLSSHIPKSLPAIPKRPQSIIDKTNQINLAQLVNAQHILISSTAKPIPPVPNNNTHNNNEESNNNINIINLSETNGTESTDNKPPLPTGPKPIVQRALSTQPINNNNHNNINNIQIQTRPNSNSITAPVKPVTSNPSPNPNPNPNKLILDINTEEEIKEITSIVNAPSSSPTNNSNKVSIKTKGEIL